MNTLIHTSYFVVIALACFDIIYAYIVAAVNKETSSKRLREGLLTHIPIMIAAGLLQFWAKDFDLEPVSAATMGFLILMYIKSLKETYVKAGGVLPKAIENLIPKDDENK